MKGLYILLILLIIVIIAILALLVLDQKKKQYKIGSYESDKKPLYPRILISPGIIMMMTTGLILVSLMLGYILYYLVGITSSYVKLGVTDESYLILLVIVASCLGSFIHMATSFTGYVGNRNLYLSWLPWFIMRPFIGMATALLFYFVYVAFAGKGLFENLDGSADLYTVLAISGLAGLFSKQTIQKLNEAFVWLFRVDESKENRDDPMVTRESEQLSKGVLTTELIDQIIRERSAGWLKKYQNVVSIASSKKQVDNSDTEIDCIQFGVKVKEDSIPEDQRIPAKIEYIDSNGKIIEIPTDVYEVGEFTTKTYKSGQAKIIQDLASEVQPGCSISRKDSGDFGSLGLKLSKYINGQKHYFILSCYHVLCSEEWRDSTMSVKFSNINNSTIETVCPAQRDTQQNTSPNILGKVVRGVLDEDHDFAVSQITVVDHNQIKNELFGRPNAPKGTVSVTSADRNKKEVFMSGRTSNTQSGLIKSHLCNPEIDYGAKKDGKRLKIKFNDVIMTEKISEDGDSGAAVVDSQGRVIGLVIGGSANASLVLPIADFLTNEGYFIENAL